MKSEPPQRKADSEKVELYLHIHQYRYRMAIFGSWLNTDIWATTKWPNVMVDEKSSYGLMIGRVMSTAYAVFDLETIPCSVLLRASVTVVSFCP